ncbi:MAG: cupin domain-containing protein, partial [Paracoccus sp. (in: a-proteobacteria)]|nr:cupin domain-containing protein [Paracoccus sp. (in: a-proteobacteria)]
MQPPPPEDDPLSQLIGLSALRPALEMRCQMAGPYMVDHPASGAGEAVFHLVLAGACRVDAEGVSLRAGAGDLMLLPRGAAHRLYCVTARPHDPAWRQHWPGIWPGVWAGPHPEPPELDVLCGKFTYLPPPGALLFAGLPAAAVVPAHAIPPAFGALIRHEAAARAP